MSEVNLTVSEIDRDDPRFLEDAPAILYKYRDWSNENHKRLIHNQELYFPSANQFNDPYDNFLPWQYKAEELTPENIYKKYLFMVKRDNPDLPDSEIQKIVYEQDQRSPLRNDEEWKNRNESQIKKSVDKYGIVSLTSEYDNFLMWSHYSNSHSGFCVGFDKHILSDQAKSQFGYVDYKTDLPTFGLFEDLMSISFRLLNTKSKCWDYEKEYRLVSIRYWREVVKISRETFRELILGVNMEQKIKFQLIDFVTKEVPHVSIYDVNLDQKLFKLNLQRIA